MSEIITAIYENGVLRPLNPLSLPEHQTLQLQVLSVNLADDDRQHTLQNLIAAGVVTPPPHRDDVELVSEEARWELAQQIGQCPGKPLSEIIIEERGPY